MIGGGLTRSPVIRALRFAGEEVQFGLVLAAICLEPAVASAFSDAVIERGHGGNPQARRRAKRRLGDATCLGEQQLEARVTRRLSRSRAQALGRVDLRFTADGDWRFAVELKQNSDFGTQQLERYAKWGPVAAIVRDASKVTVTRDDPNWVGAVSWGELLEDLHDLPIDPGWSDDWRALLGIMESDGEFDAGIPSSREVQAQSTLLESVSLPLVKHLADELRQIYKSDADVAISGLNASRVRQDRTWAGFAVSGADGPWLWLAVRNLWSAAPLLRVEYYTFTDAWAKRTLKAAHARIQARGDFVKRPDGYRVDKPEPRLADADPATALDVMAEIVSFLARSRVFDVDVERLNREHGRHRR